MNTTRLTFLAGALGLTLGLCAGPVAAQTTTTYCYKATVNLPVLRFTTVGGKTKVETKTLKESDVINIALGNPLGTSIGKRILAVRSPENPDEPGAPTPKLFIYDLNTAAVVKELGSVSGLDLDYFQPLSRGSANGFGALTVTDTGASATGKFFATTLQGAAKGGGSADPFNFKPAITAASTSASGRLKFVFTDAKGTSTYEGVVVSGKISASGKPFTTINE